MPPGNEPGAVTRAPSCYRHAGRETHLRCNRCERYICPDCMVQASVGFQCPECVRGGNQNVRPARTVFGAIARPQTLPIVTYVLIALNVAMYGLQQLVGTSVVANTGGQLTANMFEIRLELLSKATWADGQPIGVANGEWYRLVTAMFLHASIPHIAMNMLSLFFIGPMLETLIGRFRYALVYFVGGIAGNATSYFFMPELHAGVGASGAIAAVFGCLVVIGLRRRILDPTMILIVLALNVAIPLQDSSIDWRAHLGGVLSGALIGATFAYGPEIVRLLGRAQSAPAQKLKLLSGVQFATMALVLAASAGATAIHTAHLNDPASRARSSDSAQSSSYPQAIPGYPHWG